MGAGPPTQSVEQRGQGLALTRPSIEEIGAPGIDLGVVDVLPQAALPIAEIHLGQIGMHMVAPSPALELPPYAQAALQIGCMDDARPVMTACMLTDAVCQSLGLAPVNREIRATDTAPGCTDGLGMPPDTQFGHG
jgi:hypothetical protein